MDENVRPTAVRHDEAVALGRVKPFDLARDLDQACRAPVGGRQSARCRQRLDEFVAQFGPPLNAPARHAASEPLAPLERNHALITGAERQRSPKRSDFPHER